MSDLPAKPGYLRTGVLYESLEWSFEAMSEMPRIAVVTITTPEGSLDVGLGERDALRLRDNLTLFLEKTLGSA